MARERMITRTIRFTSGIMVTIDNTGKTENKPFDLAGELTAKEALKILRKTYENDDISIGGVINIATQEVLYGMPETEFMAHAKILPDRNVKE